MMFDDTLYLGRLICRRSGGNRSYRRYSMVGLRVDIDHLAAISRRLRLFGFNRLAPVAIHDEDHGPGDIGSLRNSLLRKLRAAGLHDALGGKVELLCLPRVWGTTLHRIAVFFCYRPGGTLAAICYDVQDATGGRHHHLEPMPLPQAQPDAAAAEPAAIVIKADGYQLTVCCSADRLRLRVHRLLGEFQRLEAEFLATRAPFADSTLLTALNAQSLMACRIGVSGWVLSMLGACKQLPTLMPWLPQTFFRNPGTPQVHLP